MANDKDGGRQLLLVGACGVIGGLIGWALFALWQDQPPKVNPWADPLISAGLGAVASIVFIFLIANTDRTDRNRLIALAMVGGIAWEPVLEASRAFVDRRFEQSHQQAAIGAATKAIELARGLETAAPEESEKLIRQVEMELRQATQASRKIDSVAALNSVREASKPLFTEKLAVPAAALSTFELTLDPAQFDRPAEKYGELLPPAAVSQ